METGKYVIIDERVLIGENVYIGNYVHLRPEVVIGDNTEVRDFCFLAEACKIGSNTRIMQYSNIGSGTVVGNWCFIGPRVITTNDREITYPKLPGGFWEKFPPVICDNVRIGAGVVILPGVVIEKNCRIGAGSVVTRSTKEGLTYFGNPAKVVLDLK
jgi:galactoside O-acetyltransferase